MKRIIFIILSAICLHPCSGKNYSIDLSGRWELKLGAYEAGDGKNVFEDFVQLPGTLSTNRKGQPNETVDLNRWNLKHVYDGAATYRREVVIPGSWAGKSVTLLLERTKMTRVWLNDVEQNACSSNTTLGATQEYYLTGVIPGRKNSLVIEVRNIDYPIPIKKGDNAQMIADDAQCNWNGIIGRIRLKAADPVHIRYIMVYPDIERGEALIKVVLQKDTEEAIRGKLTFGAESYNHPGAKDKIPPATKDFNLPAGAGETTVEYTYPMGKNALLWSEFHPALYRLHTRLSTDKKYGDEHTTTFGMRKFSSQGQQFTVNGKITILRGEANNGIFAVNGHPDMTKEGWHDLFAKAGSMGLNFFRFHSWCPPEAAFEAADEAGIYMQPELYQYAGNIGDDHRNYLKDEAGRLLRFLACHPSFVMMSWGNELWGGRDIARDLRRYCRTIDSTRLYAEGTNNNFSKPTFNTEDDYWTTMFTGTDIYTSEIRLSYAVFDDASGGLIERTQPNSMFDFSKALTWNSEFTKPIMSHEVGQYQVYPHFDVEIPKYAASVFEPRFLTYCRNKMQEHGLQDMNEKFSMATARTASIMYRAEIETALRTPRFGGFQLLSIQDYPGQGNALWGIFDPFMDRKPGTFTDEKFRSFNGPVTVLARIPTFQYRTTDGFHAEIVIPNYSEDDLRGVTVHWVLKTGSGKVLRQGSFAPADVPQGSVTPTGTVNEAQMFAGITGAQKLVFEVSSSVAPANTYDIWVYPAEPNTDAPKDILVSTAFNAEVRAHLAAGGKVLLIPCRYEYLPQSVAARWTNDFCGRLFHKKDPAITAYTMSMYIHAGHPVFDDFPTEDFADCQWYNMIHDSHAIILDDAPPELTPMAQTIDHFEWSKRLGAMFEARAGNGRLIVCTFDLLNRRDHYPEVRHLYNCIIRYMSSAKFNPVATLTEEYLSMIISE
jgi:hypothetical protein